MANASHSNREDRSNRPTTTAVRAVFCKQDGAEGWGMPCHHPHFKDDDIVPLSVGFDEMELREQLKKIRARWEPQIKMWFAPYGLIRGTPLEAKISTW